MRELKEKKCQPVAGFVNNLLRRQRNTFCNVNISRISASVSIVEFVSDMHKCNTLYEHLQLRNSLVNWLFFANNQQPFKDVFTPADCILWLFLYRSLTSTGSLEPLLILMMVLVNRRNLMIFIFIGMKLWSENQISLWRRSRSRPPAATLAIQEEPKRFWSFALLLLATS
jgi:hypothetical protein